MILFFDLHYLIRNTSGNEAYLVEGLRKFYLKKFIPQSSREVFKPIPGMRSGASFLLNPNDLFASKVDILYKAQYIKLAGRRNFIDYATLGNKYLDLSYFPDINYKAISTNVILKIRDKKLYFKYEEVK